MNKHIHLKLNSFLEDINITLIANLTLGLVMMETTRFTFLPLIHRLFLLLTLYLWCSIAFKNGIAKRYQFFLYISVFFVSAQVFIWLFDYLVKLRIYNKYIDWISQVLRFVVIHPYKLLIDFFYIKFHITIFTTINLIMIGICGFFFLGYCFKVYYLEKLK